MIHTGDCIEVMATMPADSVDAVVTDPPYGLEFMGRSWDRLGDVGTTSHSGPALVAGGERGQYGKVSYSGSANKKCRRCDKWAWDHEGRKCECEVPDFPNVGAHQGRLMQEWHYNWAVEALRVTKPGGYLLAFGGTRTHHRLVCGLEDAGWIIRDELDWIYASGFPKGKANLKPAHEPIVLARKPGPLRPLAIDECRIGTEGGGNVCPGGDDCECVTDGRAYSPTKHPVRREGVFGRWPSNVLLSDPELFDEPNPYVVGSGATSESASGLQKFRRPGTSGWKESQGMFTEGREWEAEGYGDSGGYSRFFIVPKADRADREPVLRGQVDAKEREAKYASIQDGRPHTPEGYVYDRAARENAHPTVKPTDLMRHLVRLVTPSRVLCWVCQGCGGTVEYTHAIQRSSTKRPELQVRGVRDDVLLGPEDDEGPAREILQPDVLEPMGSSDAPDDQGLVEDAEGIHRGVEPEAPDGDADGVHPPTSAGDGRSAGAGPHRRRGGRSSERDQGRQPAGEPAGTEQAGPRQPAEASEEADQVSALSLDDPDIGPCESCGGRLAAGERHGRVLDPFLGSGSTALACELEGFPWIGIEKEPEYVAIAEARLNGTQRGMGLDVPAPTRRDIGKQRGNKDENGQPTLAGDANLQSSWFHSSRTDEDPAA